MKRVELKWWGGGRGSGRGRGGGGGGGQLRGGANSLSYTQLLSDENFP